MVSYITIGANDVPRPGRFYAAILAPLGYVAKEAADGIGFTVPDGNDDHVAVYVRRPYDGRPATIGNGSMTAFRVETHAMVRNLHAAGLEAGGADEGAPGFRDDDGEYFYVAYLRDPAGNKVAIFCVNPAQGRRGG
jgi:hypothetical protein